ncbi:MAG: hypothetical protein FWH32_05430 [Clostridiales bacterium]|nr:hypothetical protein [Clostridiales bacterium]
MYKILLTLAFLRKHKYLLTACAGLIVFACISVWSLTHLNGLRHDIAVYEERIGSLDERLAAYHNIVQHTEGIEEDIARLSDETADLNHLIDELTDAIDGLSAENDELERLNGDLSKKFDGLSTPG